MLGNSSVGFNSGRAAAHMALAGYKVIMTLKPQPLESVCFKNSNTGNTEICNFVLCYCMHIPDMFLSKRTGKKAVLVNMFTTQISQQLLKS